MNKQRQTNFATALSDYVKSLNVQSGSVLVYKGRKDVGNELAKMITGHVPQNVLFVMLNEGEELSVIEDSAMNRAGWIRSNVSGVESS